MSNSHGDLRHDRLVMVVGWIVVGAGLAFIIIRTLNSEPPQRRDPEAMLASISFGVAIAAPGFMALLARYQRPALVVPAAIILVPFAFLSLAGVLLPLLVPAFLLVRVYARHRRPGEGLLDAGVAMSLFTVSIMSIAVLLIDTTEKVYRTPTSTHSTSVPSAWSSIASIALVASGLMLAWWATTPRRADQRSAATDGATATGWPDDNARHSDR